MIQDHRSPLSKHPSEASQAASENLVQTISQFSATATDLRDTLFEFSSSFFGENRRERFLVPYFTFSVFSLLAVVFSTEGLGYIFGCLPFSPFFFMTDYSSLPPL